MAKSDGVTVVLSKTLHARDYMRAYETLIIINDLKESSLLSIAVGADPPVYRHEELLILSFRPFDSHLVE